VTFGAVVGPEFLPSPEAPSFGPAGSEGLEIGGGTHPRRLAFTQFDAIDWSEQTKLTYDLGDARALPYDHERFDHVFASNILEHFPASETTAVLTEWARVLVPDGVLELVVPDSMGVLRAYFDGTDKWAHTAERLLGSRDYPGNEHFAPFTMAEFPDVIAAVPTLKFAWAVPCAAGCGIHALAAKIGA
jgi:predicted SAM-dependent methyltransferase